jgi:hypothetical protein
MTKYLMLDECQLQIDIHLIVAVSNGALHQPPSPTTDQRAELRSIKKCIPFKYVNINILR